ncbi:DUF3906 family protein [Paenibacillus terrigena]|uniref:DUF3906 family protein n=1 Tax=Paenibacillus terrigena TaxID=369333 RepID=UPI0003824750|nr:DUF3906 family protein [Paenibacillus terrigena]
MYLYRVEIELEEQLVYLIVVAETDEKAFSYVDSHMDRHFLASPAQLEVSILEKKRLDKGAGYVIETHRK